MLRIDRGVEERAAATVPASIGDASVKHRWLLQYSLPGTARSFANRDDRPCQLGDGSYPGFELPLPSMSKGLSAVLTEAAQTDATYVANSLSPETLAGFVLIPSVTDAARFAGLDASLRLALNAGLQEKLDEQAIEGTDGLLTGTNLG